MEKISSVLGEVEGWKGLGGWLNVKTEAIESNCLRDSDIFKCCRRQLVKSYCDREGKSAEEVAEDFASTLENRMNNKRVAKSLRKLTFECENCDTVGLINFLILQNIGLYIPCIPYYCFKLGKYYIIL